MNIVKIKEAAKIVAVAAVVGAGAYWYSASAHSPEIVTISQTACGVPSTSASFGVPIATLAEHAPGVPFSFGPIEAPEGGGAITIRFDPSADGKGREVTMAGDTLHLPVAYGRSSALPERVVVTCRDGEIATVRYSGSGERSVSFSVVAQAQALAGTEEAATITQ